MSIFIYFILWKEGEKVGLYDTIKEIAEEKGVSVYRIEKDLELSNGQISKWNKVTPYSITLYRVAQYLGVSIEDILEEGDTNGNAWILQRQRHHENIWM